jgi:hypothetical protein
MLSQNINTTQFLNVTTPSEARQGSTVYKDLNNPGDYYKETATGHIYLIQKKQHFTSENNGSNKVFSAKTYSSTHCINSRTEYRGKNKPQGYKLLHNQLDRLARIQYVSDKRARRVKTLSSIITTSNEVTRIIPG